MPGPGPVHIRGEQFADGSWVRQPNNFLARFGDGPGRIPVEPGRYRILAAAGCGWTRRQLILRRILGLEDAISVGFVTGRNAADKWTFDGLPGDVDPVLGVNTVEELYVRTDPTFDGRATVPVVADVTTGLAVTNNYHTLSLDFETAWKPYHAPGAPDLYPEDLRREIDILNQVLFDDINNGPYKVLFARGLEAARAAKGVWEARLADLDFRLSTRRYLFGERLTESDLRLFISLQTFDTHYRPSFPAELGRPAAITDFPNVWGFARELLQTPGWTDERELVAVGLKPRPDGRYSWGFGQIPITIPQPDEDPLAKWLEPHGREHLTGSPVSSGPGGAGTADLWRFAEFL